MADIPCGSREMWRPACGHSSRGSLRERSRNGLRCPWLRHRGYAVDMAKDEHRPRSRKPIVRSDGARSKGRSVRPDRSRARRERGAQPEQEHAQGREPTERRRSRKRGVQLSWPLVFVGVLAAFGGGFLAGRTTAPPSPVSLEKPTVGSVEQAFEDEESDELVPGQLYAVKDIIDGDTIDIEGDVRIRFLGVNTPETGGRKGVEWFGPQAKAFTLQLLEGRKVRLRGDKDELEQGRFGRWLAYIERDDGLDVTAALVRSGHAFSYRKYPCGRTTELDELESQARAKRVGMWSRPAPEPAAYNGRVLVTKSSGIVHAADCGNAPSEENAIPFDSVEEAAAAGYTDLHRCLE